MLIQTWSHGSDNDLNRYSSYSGNLQVNEIIFCSYNRELVQTFNSYVTPTSAIIINFANTHIHIMYMALH